MLKPVLRLPVAKEVSDKWKRQKSEWAAIIHRLSEPSPPSCSWKLDSINETASCGAHRKWPSEKSPDSKHHHRLRRWYQHVCHHQAQQTEKHSLSSSKTIHNWTEKRNAYKKTRHENALNEFRRIPDICSHQLCRNGIIKTRSLSIWCLYTPCHRPSQSSSRMSHQIEHHRKRVQSRIWSLSNYHFVDWSKIEHSRYSNMTQAKILRISRNDFQEKTTCPLRMRILLFHQELFCIYAQVFAAGWLSLPALEQCKTRCSQPCKPIIIAIYWYLNTDLCLFFI